MSQKKINLHDYSLSIITLLMMVSIVMQWEYIIVGCIVYCFGKMMINT